MSVEALQKYPHPDLPRGNLYRCKWRKTSTFPTSIVTAICPNRKENLIGCGRSKSLIRIRVYSSSEAITLIAFSCSPKKLAIKTCFVDQRVEAHHIIGTLRSDEIIDFRR